MTIRRGLACIVLVAGLVPGARAFAQTVPDPGQGGEGGDPDSALDDPADTDRTLGTVPAATPEVTAPPAAAPAEPPPEPVQYETEGWFDRSLLFNLNNIFQNATFLGGWQGFGFGFQKLLASGSAVRVGLDLTRYSDPADVVKTTHENGTDVTVTYEVDPPVWTSIHGAVVGVDYLMSLQGRALAPYAGVGLLAGYNRFALDYTDDLSVTDVVTEVHDSTNTMSIGARGILGVNWRLNRRFALFVEYQLVVEAVTWVSSHDQTTVTDSSSGEPATSRDTTESEETRFLNLDTGLGQGAALGLSAHF